MAIPYSNNPRLLSYSREDDSKWPEKNKDGRQELEIRLGNEHISFEVRCVTHQPGESLLMLDTPDCEDWFFGRRHRICGSRGPTGILLFGTGSQSACFLADIPPLQGNAIVIRPSAQSDY